MGKVSDVSGLGPSDLEADYLGATDRIILAQSYANLLLKQPILDLPVDAGLAFKVKTYQGVIQARATYFNNQLMGRFIRAFASTQNFVGLYDAFASLDVPLLRVAFDNTTARTTVSVTSSSLSEQAQTTSQDSASFARNLGVVSGELATLEADFDGAIKAALTSMGAAATQVGAQIDALKAAINQNISDVVAGANKVGGAITQLAVGVLTTIDSAAGDDKAGDGDDDKPKGDKGDDSSDPPSTEFAAQAIVSGAQGAEQTAQARADLEANNKKLADAYQQLAKLDGLIAIGKVVQVQSQLFTSSMKDGLDAVQKVVDAWGTITGEFSDFATRVDTVGSQQAASALATQVTASATDWESLGETLAYLKAAMNGLVPGAG